jgi:hypothetical protein
MLLNLSILGKLKKAKALFAFVFLFSALLFSFASVDASGCSENNMEGYAWSDNIGWISFSCMNEYEIGAGINYGVSFSRSSGLMSGQAWSDNIGWISFDSDDLTGCPSGDCEAVIVDGELQGWAKVVAEDDWIALSGTTDDSQDYGVTFDGEEFYGYAWGSETTGWISFNCEDEGVCGTTDYQVSANTSQISIRTDSAVVSYDEDTDIATVKLQGRIIGMRDNTEADVWFEWGETEETMTKDNDTVQTVTEEQDFYSEITIESPVSGGVYYFKAVGEDDAGVVEGLTESFSLLTCNPNNVRGYAWSDNIGWISFSCMNEYNEGEGVDYGVSVNSSTNTLSGYAWSGDVGWISFEEDDLTGCPEEPCQATIDGEQLTGWAKVIGEDDDEEGHEEWISLSGDVVDSEETYGVEFVIPYFSGYAWGDGVVGWISFNCEDEGTCATTDYKVYTTNLTLLARTDPAIVNYNKDDDYATIILNGMLLGLGSASEADVWFEWGETEGTMTKDEGTVQTMSDTGAFSSELVIDNPVQGDTYYFKAMAESTERKAQGSVLTFEISQTDGDLIIKYKGEQKIIEINSGGRIEVLE